MKKTAIPIVIGGLVTVNKGLVQGLVDLEIRGYPNNTIVDIGLNIRKSPEDLRRFPDTHTPVENSI